MRSDRWLGAGLVSCILGGKLVGCGCETANWFELPDDDSVRSIALEGPECFGRMTGCAKRYASGRCRATYAEADHDARCTVRVEYASGPDDSFEARYQSTGCMDCIGSSLDDEVVNQAIARRADVVDAAAPSDDR